MTADRGRKLVLSRMDEEIFQQCKAWREKRDLPNAWVHHGEYMNRWNTPQSLTCPECGEQCVAQRPQTIYPPCRCLRELAKHIEAEYRAGPEWQFAVQWHLREAKIPDRWHCATFAEFEPVRGAKAGAAAVEKWADAYTLSTSWGLLLTGSWGSGKTHLAVAALRRTVEREMPYAKFASTILLVREFMKGSTSSTGFVQPFNREVIEDAAQYELLVLDDIGQEHNSEFVRSVVHELIEDRYQNDRPIIATSNLGLGEIADRLGGAIASRLREMCIVIELTAGDYRQLVAKRRTSA